jgi:hypothetical protein
LNTKGLTVVFKGRLRYCGLHTGATVIMCGALTVTFHIPPFKLLTSDKWLWNCEIIPGVGRIVVDCV